MAGAGFKTFASGEVLTAANVNTYLMQQTVMVFADSSARSTALGANVSEGMLSYLKDTNQVEVYNGSAWVASDDPNAIQNTIVDAKGDLISATAADTPARLASSGVNGEVLTIDTSTATGLKWATVSAGGMTTLASGSLSGSTVTLSSISGSYKDLILIVNAPSLTSGQGVLTHRFNNNSTSQSYKMNINYVNMGDQISYGDFSNQTFVRYCGGSNDLPSSADPGFAYLRLRNYTNTTTYKQFDGFFYSAQANRFGSFSGAQTDLTASAINEITITTGTSTFDAGTYILYGVS